jgi:hypothetical protein
MTLSVTVHRRDPTTGELIDESSPEPGATLGGFEVWRTRVYGSDATRRRGAVFLPRLADTDLWIEGEELPAFVAEVSALLADVEAFASEVNVAADYLAERLGNFLAAAERATQLHGAVWIS